MKALAILLVTVALSGNSQAAAKVSHSDPLEPVNRVVFGFNDKFDSWLLKPVARGYDAVTPKPVQGLIGNFFQNLEEIRNVVNALLQLEVKQASVSTGRFLVNSTVGMLGMVDVGTAVGLEYQYNDFGLTLGRWNVPSGPYVVVPFLGGRTLRAAAGIYPNFMMYPVTYVNDSQTSWALWGVGFVNLRASLLDKEGLIVGDKYTFLRDAYLQRRDFQLTGEVPQDDF